MRHRSGPGTWALLLALAVAPAAGAETRPKASGPRAAAPSTAQPARKGQLDPAAQEALGKTQDLLRNPAARAEALRSDPKARAANQRVEAVARSPKSTQRIYEISADVMADVAARGEGDPARMSQIVESAQRDPAAFLQSLPPEQRAAIQQLAAELVKEHPEMAGQATP